MRMDVTTNSGEKISYYLLPARIDAAPEVVRLTRLGAIPEQVIGVLEAYMLSEHGVGMEIHAGNIISVTIQTLPLIVSQVLGTDLTEIQRILEDPLAQMQEALDQDSNTCFFLVRGEDRVLH